VRAIEAMLRAYVIRIVYERRKSHRNDPVVSIHQEIKLSLSKTHDTMVRKKVVWRSRQQGFDLRPVRSDTDSMLCRTGVRFGHRHEVQDGRSRIV